jgi:hypothetical protein
LTPTPGSDAFRFRRDRNKLRIANFIALSGPAGIWGPSATNSTLLAASEINRRGGILGREIEVVFHDAGASIEDVVRCATDMVASEDADIVMGSHMSAVRLALRKVVAGRIPYIYTPVYEGGEQRTVGAAGSPDSGGAAQRDEIGDANLVAIATQAKSVGPRRRRKSRPQRPRSPLQQPLRRHWEASGRSNLRR